MESMRLNSFDINIKPDVAWLNMFIARWILRRSFNWAATPLFLTIPSFLLALHEQLQSQPRLNSNKLQFFVHFSLLDSRKNWFHTYIKDSVDWSSSVCTVRTIVMFCRVPKCAADAQNSLIHTSNATPTHLRAILWWAKAGSNEYTYCLSLESISRYRPKEDMDMYTVAGVMSRINSCNSTPLTLYCCLRERAVQSISKGQVLKAIKTQFKSR